MLLSIDEILRNINELRSREEMIATFIKYDHPAIRAVLRGAYDPDIKWKLPTGPVPYRSNELFDQQGMLLNEYKQFYIFIEGNCENLRQSRRELLFVQFLESLHTDDARLMVYVKDKKLPYNNITPELINAAYPGLLPNVRGVAKSVPVVPWFREADNVFEEIKEPERVVEKVKRPPSPATLASLEKARAVRKLKYEQARLAKENGSVL